MKLPESPFTVLDWSALPAIRYEGSSGYALWRTVMMGDARIRLVEYSPGYVADHWCDRGHILHVLEGGLQCELANGAVFQLRPGFGYLVSDFGDSPHRSSTVTGAKLFIVD